MEDKSCAIKSERQLCPVHLCGANCVPHTSPASQQPQGTASVVSSRTVQEGRLREVGDVSTVTQPGVGVLGLKPHTFLPEELGPLGKG